MTRILLVFGLLAVSLVYSSPVTSGLTQIQRCNDNSDCSPGMCCRILRLSRRRSADIPDGICAQYVEENGSCSRTMGSCGCKAGLACAFPTDLVYHAWGMFGTCLAAN